MSAASRPLVVVDAANVVGSRPDGWWRDRAGAAERLVTAIATHRAEDDPEENADAPGYVVVLEGDAVDGAAPGSDGRVTVVHAQTSGDDEIVRVVADAVDEDPQRSVTVVTADRALRRRVEDLGAHIQGPRQLWRRIDENH